MQEGVWTIVPNLTLIFQSLHSQYSLYGLTILWFWREVTDLHFPLCTILNWDLDTSLNCPNMGATEEDSSQCKVRWSYLRVINLVVSTYSQKSLYMYKLINPRLQSEYIPEVYTRPIPSCLWCHYWLAYKHLERVGHIMCSSLWSCHTYTFAD